MWKSSSMQATMYDFLNSCLRSSEVLVVDEHLGSSCVWASSGKPSTGTYQLNTYTNETFTAGATTRYETMLLSPKHNCTTLVADLLVQSTLHFRCQSSPSCQLRALTGSSLMLSSLVCGLAGSPNLRNTG